MALFGVSGSNSQPKGGSTALQPSEPNSLTPSDIQALVDQLQPAVAKFRDQSSQIPSFLKQFNFNSAQSQTVDQQQINNVGLGYRLVTHWHFVLSFANTTGGAQVISVSPNFPYNLIKNQEIGINGGAAQFTASGLGTLATMVRQKRGVLRKSLKGGFGPALDPALCQITVATATPTNAGAATDTLSGIASISVANTATGVITVDFVTVEKLAFDRESMLGALPLQNNQVFANVTRTLNNIIGTTPASPVYIGGGVPAGVATTFTGYAVSEYDFCSVPDNDQLYASMIANSYQIKEQALLAIGATGPDALQYAPPSNIYLTALHLINLRDGNDVPLPYAALPKFTMSYNAGVIRTVIQDPVVERGKQFLDYNYDPQSIPGWRFWDGSDTTEQITSTDQMGWLDLYHSTDPLASADILAGTVTPVNVNILREAVVADANSVVQ